jgi:enamine deaminase RidA (YjgF/YER057c/UK114 family)
MELFTRLSHTLQEFDATILNLLVFGSVEAYAAATEAMRRVLGKIDWPLTWVEGAGCSEHPIAGIHVFALSGGNVQRISVEKHVLASVFDDGAARYCLLGGLGSSRPSQSRAVQTQETLDCLEQTLDEAGFSLRDVARTWFFLDDILTWYPEFNQVRTKEYSRVKFNTGSLPASTGVSGRNPARSALALAAWAIQPADASTMVREVASPLQCPAPAYGSSFSRAMEISSSSGHRLFISGTASIAPEGQTLWPESAAKQVDLSMQVIDAILRSRGFKFADLTRATAYFKDASDVPVFTSWGSANELPQSIVVPALCDICRDDLLFEIEAEAWKSA